MSYTRAKVEYMSDKTLLCALDEAEKATGFTTGLRFSDTGKHIISVTFYPKTQFWIDDANTAGSAIDGTRRLLTREEYDKTRGLAL